MQAMVGARIEAIANGGHFGEESVAAKPRHQPTPGYLWLATFMHYDLGYIDLEQRTLQTIDNPFGTRLSPMS